MFRLLELPVFGGEEPVLLTGDWSELWEAREEVREKCRLLAVTGTDLWAGDVRKSDPGDVDNDGPSDFEHSETCGQYKTKRGQYLNRVSLGKRGLNFSTLQALYSTQSLNYYTVWLLKEKALQDYYYFTQNPDFRSSFSSIRIERVCDGS